MRVEVTRDGKTVSAEEKLSLVGGEARAMEFNLDSPKLVALK